MKKQSLIILILLLIGALLLGYFFKSSKRADRQQSASVLKNIGADIKIKDIGTVHINEMRLEYEADTEYYEGWVYKDTEKKLTLPVSSEKIQDFLEDVQNFSQGRLVEAQPSDLVKYGLEKTDDKEKAPYTLSLESKSDETMFTFMLSQSTSPTYARFQDDEAVYKVASTLHSAISSESLYWLDTRIFPDEISLDEIESISINPQEVKEIVLTKTDGVSKKKNKKDESAETWTLTDSSVTLDGSKVSRYLQSLVEAKAKDFSDVQIKDAVKDAEVIIRLKSGLEYGLTLYSFADDFYVKRKADYTRYTFLVTKYLKDTLFPRSEEPFIAEPEKDEKSAE